jgi:ferric-dicitrate binding protein FerR (iron transport regulator)
MEEKKYIPEIITQYLHHRYGHETEEKVQRWLIDETDAADKDRSLTAYWNTLPEGASRKTYASLAQLKKRLGMKETPAVIPLRRSWLRVAAVLLPLAVLTGGYFLLKNMTAQQDTVVSISVPFGENREIRLPDASTVYLNAGSSIQYPESFDKNVRCVKLSGEACFTVNKDASRPFIVETEYLSVEVLGTEFNVKAYPDETKTTTTLISGKIKVETKTAQPYTLSPNQQLSYNSKSERMDVVHVNAGDYSAWKNGHLIFDDMPLSEIISTVERKFDVAIRMDDSVDSGNRYSVKFVHGESLSEVMKILGATCGFSSRIEDKTILLMQN